MKVLFADQPPVFDGLSIFLAGPTPRSSEVASWRLQALEVLKQRGFTGWALVPERQDWVAAFDYTDQVEWEFTCLEAATVIAFWIPRDLHTLPGFTTNVEFGRYIGSGRCVYGRPEDAPKNRYLDWLYTKLTGSAPCRSLEETFETALQRIGFSVTP